MTRPRLTNASSHVQTLVAEVATIDAEQLDAGGLASLCHMIRSAMARASSAPDTLFGEGAFDATGCIDLAILRGLHDRIEAANNHLAMRR